MEQRSAQWFEARRGKFTASKFSCLIGKGITATAHTYILEKIVEDTYGIKEGPSTEAMQWGVEHEAEAIEYYTLLTGHDVELVGFVEGGTGFGGSPDALVNTDGINETKCPFNPINHLRYGLCETAKDLKKLNKANYWQCQGNMLATGRKWCDFVSFDPRLEGAAKMYILRVERDEQAIEELEQAIERAILRKNTLKEQLGL